MTYINQMNEFIRLIPKFNLPPSAVSVYLTVFGKFNELGWPEEVAISDRAMQELINVGSTNTVTSAKKLLEKFNFLQISQKPKSRTTYRLVDLSICRSATDGATDGETDGETDFRFPSLLNIKTKTKTKTYNTICAREEIPDEPNPFIIAPTLDEVKAEAEAQGYTHVDVEYFYRYYTGTDWTDSGGNSILRRWKVKLMAWNKQEAEKAAKRSVQNVSRAVPSKNAGRTKSLAAEAEYSDPAKLKAYLDDW